MRPIHRSRAARLGLDTNVLIYAHVPSLEHHTRVHAYLTELLARDGVTLVVTPAILHELVHVITDARRFEPPVTIPDAVALARRYLTASNVECIATTQEVAVLAFELMLKHRLGRKRLADTLFAATLISAGVDRVVTCNPSDFAPFDGLTPIDPLS